MENAQNSYNFVSTYRTYHECLKLRVNTRDTWVRFGLGIPLFIDIKTWTGFCGVQVVMPHDKGLGELPVQFLQ